MKRQILALTALVALTTSWPAANAQPGDPGRALAAGVVGGLVGGLLLGPPPPPPAPYYPPAPPVYRHHPGPPPAYRYREYDDPPRHFSRGYRDRDYDDSYGTWDE
jgi:hypothetical protein